MKNRIHFLEGNRSQPPLSIIDRNTPPSHLSISTPLIDRIFPSQQPSNHQLISSTPQLNNFSNPSSTTMNLPYYAQNPYFSQQQPPNNSWQYNTPQGFAMNQNGIYVQQNSQDVNRHFLDYAMLDYFSARR
jgi:hypothetical protein